MMKTSIEKSISHLLLLLILTMLSSCLSFKSVQLTAKIGKDFEKLPDPYNYAQLFCDYDMGGKLWSARCANVKKASSDWKIYSKILFQYSLELEKIAKGDDIEFADELGESLAAVSETELLSLKEGHETIAKAIEFIVGFAADFYRKKAIKKALDESDEHIQIITQTFANILGQHIADFKDLKKEIRKTIKLQSKFPYHYHKDTTGILKAENMRSNINMTYTFRWSNIDTAVELDEQIQELKDAKKKLLAFAVAHKELKENANSFKVKDDAKTVTNIIGKVLEVFEEEDESEEHEDGDDDH